MNKEETKKFIINEFAKKIRDIMTVHLCTELYQLSSIEKFEIIKRVASLINELFKDKKTRAKFIELISKSAINGNNPELRFETFEMIRNLNSHFPNFDTWNEVFISDELLTWDRKFSKIKNYFNNNYGKSLNYDIYVKTPFGWEKRHTVNFVIPKLKSGVNLYLKNVISEDDVIWTFCLIDSLLEYLGLNITDYSGYSM